jgi:UDP:flavonoid glycosyltransferase YjiC (YdhE family)
VVSTGAGLGLHPADATPEAVADAVSTVLHEPQFRAAAAELSQQVASMPGPEQVVARLKQFVTPA